MIRYGVIEGNTVKVDEFEGLSNYQGKRVALIFTGEFAANEENRKKRAEQRRCFLAEKRKSSESTDWSVDEINHYIREQRNDDRI